MDHLSKLLTQKHLLVGFESSKFTNFPAYIKNYVEEKSLPNDLMTERK